MSLYIYIYDTTVLTPKISPKLRVARFNSTSDSLMISMKFNWEKRGFDGVNIIYMGREGPNNNNTKKMSRNAM